MDLFKDLRVGSRVTLRDWQRNMITGRAFLAPSGAWLMRTGASEVFPIVPREVVRVEDGACATFARLTPGARVVMIDYAGREARGIARPMQNGLWECVATDGARWLLEPCRLANIDLQEDT